MQCENKKETPDRHLFFCWPTRTRTLNDWTKTSCVTNYTIGQYLIADANL